METAMSHLMPGIQSNELWGYVIHDGEDEAGKCDAQHRQWTLYISQRAEGSIMFITSDFSFPTSKTL